MPGPLGERFCLLDRRLFITGHCTFHRSDRVRVDDVARGRVVERDDAGRNDIGRFAATRGAKANHRYSNLYCTDSQKNAFTTHETNACLTRIMYVALTRRLRANVWTAPDPETSPPPRTSEDRFPLGLSTVHPMNPVS